MKPGNIFTTNSETAIWEKVFVNNNYNCSPAKHYLILKGGNFTHYQNVIGCSPDFAPLLVCLEELRSYYPFTTGIVKVLKWFLRAPKFTSQHSFLESTVEMFRGKSCDKIIDFVKWM